MKKCVCVYVCVYKANLKFLQKYIKILFTLNLFI